MAIIQDGPKLTRREELEFEIVGLIEETVSSDEEVSPVALAGYILDLIEVETGLSFDGQDEETM
jgi:hypothetical protein